MPKFSPSVWTLSSSIFRRFAVGLFCLATATQGTPIAQQQLLRPNDVQQDALFGRSVAVSGDTMVIGAPGHAGWTGAAYVFVRTNGLWAQQASLKASNKEGGDQFGCSVAISGDTVVVGARFESSGTTGVNSVPNEAATDSGAAYVFTRTSGIWTQQAYLKASNTGANDLFGESVSVSGNTVVVGANREGSSTTTVNSTPNESATNAGAAYVFVRDGSTWTQQAYLKSNNGGASDHFGGSVGVSGNTIIVGALGEDTSGSGVNPMPDNAASGAGAAYIFTRTSGVWSQEALFKASNVPMTLQFGGSVAISGETAVVGAAYEDSATTGVNNAPSGTAYWSGAAYVFVKSGGVWTQQAYLKASNTGASDTFGYSVAISGDTVVVGANQEDSGTTGVNSLPNEGITDSGAAYVFTRTSTTWTQKAYLKASNTGNTDWFGAAVGVSGDTVVVGAYREDVLPFSDGAGATYTFTDLPSPLPTGMSARGLVGQADFDDRVLTPSETVVGDTTMVAISPTGRTAVVDQTSHRVLLWNTMPNSSTQPADVVVGQPDLSTFSSGVSATKLKLPFGVAFSPDGTKLLVVDSGNNRLLIWNSIPTSHGAPADVVIGQADFTSHVFATSSTGLSVPLGLAFSPGGKLLLCDGDNNRVLVYNSIPTTSTAAADVVIGQTSFTTRTAGTGSTQMQNPGHVAVAWDGRLIVSDNDNRRVLVYNAIPTANGAAANTVIGQSAFDTRAWAGQSAVAMDSPWGVAVSPIGQLAITDVTNHRVLIYDSIPTSHGAAADHVLGQPDFSSETPDNGGINAATMNRPIGVAFSKDNRLWVAGGGMRRVMIFGDAPQVAVTGNSTDIVNGDMLPASADHTDFGDTFAQTGNTVRTFTLQNQGTAVLQPGTVTVSGTHAADFSVTLQPESTVLPGSSTTFQITFRPAARTLRTAILSFTTNDVDESPFSFGIQGQGIGPEISVFGNGLEILHRDQSPRPEDNTDMGQTALAGGSITRTFTLQNTGDSDLLIGELVFSSTYPQSFAVTRAPESPVIPGGSTTFDITFTPAVAGYEAAGVMIPNNDGDESPYRFNLSASGLGSRLKVFGASEIINGDNTPSFIERTDFGNAPVGGVTITQTFFLQNTGNEDLTFGTVTLSGANADEFSITQIPAGPVSVNNGTTLGITFRPGALGLRSATVSFGSNDPLRNPFTFSIQGTGINRAPTDITLSRNTVSEANFPGTVVGQFTITDADPGQSHAYSLVAGAGDEGNSAFAISGNRLLAKVATDFETKNSYSIRVHVDDNGNPPLAFEKEFTITVTDVNEAALQIAQKAFLKGGNTQDGDLFGASVAISGDTVVVGAGREDSGSTGVNSTSNEDTLEAGAAYVFVRNGAGWTQQAYLKASNPETYNWFGSSVAISGDTIVIGASNERSSTTGVNSVPNNTTTGAGAAYIFTRHEGEWTQQAYLKASNTGASDYFGYAVAISGDTVIVGAYGEDSTSTGVNSIPNENAFNAGAAYIFVRDANTWTQQAYLKALNAKSYASAGYSVAISGDTAVMCTMTFDSGNPDGGEAHVFTRTGTAWSHQAALKPSQGEQRDWFGYAVSISGNTLVVGAIEEDGSSPGVNGSLNNFAPGSGAAYVFTRVGTVWSQQAYLKASYPREGDRFGSHVAVSGDTIVVGAHFQDGSGVGVDSISAYSANDAGAAYVFLRTGTTWSQQAYLKAHNTETEDRFGAVALSGDSVIVGAPREDSSLPGTVGIHDNLATDAGAVYIYSLPQTVELTVSGNNVNIIDGDNSPSLTDGTDFGAVSEGLGSLTRTFMLQNMGTTPLTLGSFVISGAHAGDFTLSQLPATSVAGGDITYLEITFNPGALGMRKAALQFTSNDADEAAFSFNLQGNGVDAEIEVSGNSVGIVSGDVTPSLTNGTDFGRMAVGAIPTEHSFFIRNTGSSNLEISGLTITGPHTANFSLHEAPSSTLAPGAGTSFKIWYVPDAGVQRATVSFTTNDPDEGNYSFAIWGTGYWGTRAAQTVTFNPPATLFVNQGPVILSASASSGLPVSLSILSGPATLHSGNVLTLTGTGSVKISASQAGNSGYGRAPTLIKTITIKPAAAAPMLVDLNQTYNGMPRGVRVISANNTPVISYTVNKQPTNTPPVNAGSYPVKAVVDGKTLTGSLVIAKAPLLVATDSHRRFIGQTNPALTVNYSGFAGNDTESSVFAATGAKRPILKTTATPASAGGLYPITASGAVMLNYVPVYANGQMLVETFAGAYEALLTGTDTLPAAKVEFTVTASSTALSGKLTVPGEAAPIPFNGTLMVNSGEEKATGAIKPVTKNGNTYAVTFDLPFGMDFQSQMRINDVLTAETDDGKKIYTPPAGRTLYDIGAYTMILAPALPAGPDVPAGSGHATVTIDSKLVLKIAGRLADGTTLTASLQPNGYVELGYQLFSQPYARAGSYLAGWLDFENHPGPLSQRYIPASAGCDLAWAKTGRTTDKSYRDDFGPVLTRVTVDPWIVPSKTETFASLLGLSGTPTLDVSHSGFGSAAFGYLPVEVTLNAANKLVVTQATNSTKWSATITPATGAFAGSFELLDAGKKRIVPFTGVLRQPHGTGGTLGAGHALVPALPTDLSKETISGAIRFDP